MSKIPNKSFIFYLLSFIFYLHACNAPTKTDPTVSEPVTIAISKGAPAEYYGAYGKWLEAADSSVVWIDMYHMSLDSALTIFKSCDGLLVSGGPDVFPGRYGKAKDTIRCGDIDYKRDTLELALIERALNKKMPIFGVCRGLQILNVALGGSLIVDIPSDFDTTIVHRAADVYGCLHPMQVSDNFLLKQVSGIETGEVNSSHHQAIDRLADGLVISAFAPDELPEAIEWEDPSGKSYLMAVQWHPERLDFENELSGKLALHFLDHIKQYHTNRSR